MTALRGPIAHAVARTARRGTRALLAVLLLTLVLPGRGAAQQLPPTPSAQSRWSLLTVGPGLQVHALFGHSALRLVDPLYRLDITFNYGTFDFGPDFLPRFIHGELDYFLAVQDTAHLLEGARRDGRGVVEQQLALDADQTRRLYVALYDNARPDKRTYRYDFLYDNCSTRIVDMLADVLGPALVLPDASAAAPSFREQIDAYLGATPWLRLGIHVSLGPEVDGASDVGQTWFLPQAYRQALDAGRLDGEPLVLATRTLLEQPPLTSSTPAALHPTLLAWVLAGLAGLGLVRRLVTGRRRGPWLDRLLFGVLGLLGLILTYFWLGTLHHVADRNWNLAWAWPTHLAVVPLLGRRPLPGWLRLYLLAAAGAAAVAASGLAVPQQLADEVTPLGVLVVLRVLTLLAPARAEGD